MLQALSEQIIHPGLQEVLAAEADDAADAEFEANLAELEQAVGEYMQGAGLEAEACVAAKESERGPPRGVARRASEHT